MTKVASISRISPAATSDCSSTTGTGNGRRRSRRRDGTWTSSVGASDPCSVTMRCAVGWDLNGRGTTGSASSRVPADLADAFVGVFSLLPPTLRPAVKRALVRAVDPDTGGDTVVMQSLNRVFSSGRRTGERPPRSSRRGRSIGRARRRRVPSPTRAGEGRRARVSRTPIVPMGPGRRPRRSRGGVATMDRFAGAPRAVAMGPRRLRRTRPLRPTSLPPRAPPPGRPDVPPRHLRVAPGERRRSPRRALRSDRPADRPGRRRTSSRRRSPVLPDDRGRRRVPRAVRSVRGPRRRRRTRRRVAPPDAGRPSRRRLLGRDLSSPPSRARRRGRVGFDSPPPHSAWIKAPGVRRPVLRANDRRDRSRVAVVVRRPSRRRPAHLHPLPGVAPDTSRIHYDRPDRRRRRVQRADRRDPRRMDRARRRSVPRRRDARSMALRPRNEGVAPVGRPTMEGRDRRTRPLLRETWIRSVGARIAEAGGNDVGDLLKRYARFRQVGPLERAVTSARLSLLARIDELDAHPHLLNVRNGVVDLRTGDLEPHDPALMFTMLAGADYDPKARHDDVDAMLCASATNGSPSRSAATSGRRRPGSRPTSSPSSTGPARMESRP